MRPQASTTLSVLLISVIGAFSWATAAETGHSQPYPYEGTRAHLYVADDNGPGYVYEFPFGRNGLPATTPETTLNVGVLPGGMAFDSRGNFFVASAGSEQVRVVAPGPLGAKRLTHTYQFSSYYPVDLKVGPQDYVYVNLLYDGTYINIYPPGLGDPTTPVAQIFLGSHKYGGNFALDRAGALYLRTAEYAQVVLVYSHPRISQLPDAMLAVPNGYYLYDMRHAIAVDRDNQLDIEVHLDAPQPWGNADFDVHDLSGNIDDRVILTRDCAGEDGYPGLSNGAAIRQPYLFNACTEDGTVYVYRADVFGQQHYVMFLDRNNGPILSPTDVIVGP